MSLLVFDLHSNMFLLRRETFVVIAASGVSFTFQYVSIKTSDIMILDTVCF